MLALNNYITNTTLGGFGIVRGTYDIKNPT